MGGGGSEYQTALNFGPSVMCDDDDDDGTGMTGWFFTRHGASIVAGRYHMQMYSPSADKMAAHQNISPHNAGRKKAAPIMRPNLS